MHKSVDAPKTLALKLGAPVFLTVNLSHKYVNGLTGEVVGMHDDGVDVFFHDIKEKVKVCPHNFYQYDIKNNTMCFVARQIPLILCYAMTIHKSQGMTLPSVHVDCQGAFAPGQISVAISRVRNISDITVKKFREGLCPPHSPAINKFYGHPSVPLLEDLSCCVEGRSLRATQEPIESTSDTGEACDSDTETDESDTDSEPTSSGVLEEPCTLPSQLCGESMKEKLLYPHTYTQLQETINDLITSTSHSKLNTCTNHFYNELMDIVQSHYTKEGDSKQINSVVFKFIQQYRRSDDFTQHLLIMFNCEKLENPHISVGVSMLLRIQDYYFAHSTNTAQQQSVIVQEPYSQNRSKVRYIGGMCIGRILSKYTNYVCDNCHKDSEEVHKKKSTISKLQHHIFNTLTIAKDESQCIDTLEEIIHRQYKYGHLTIIDDHLFNMFLQLDRIIHDIMSTNTWYKEKDNFFQYLMSCSLDELYKLKDPIYEHLDAFTMRPVFAIYLRTCLKEMGYRIAQTFKVKKKLAHRKQVMLEENNMVPMSSRVLSTQIGNTAEISTPCEVPSTSQDDMDTTSPSNKRCSEDDANTCIICLKRWNDKSHLLCVECTSCNMWLHKKCDRTLKNPKRWKVVSQQGSKYPCPKCRKKGKFYGMCGEWNPIFTNHGMIMGVEDGSIAMVERFWNNTFFTYHVVVGASLSAKRVVVGSLVSKHFPFWTQHFGPEQWTGSYFWDRNGTIIRTARNTWYKQWGW